MKISSWWARTVWHCFAFKIFRRLHSLLETDCWIPMACMDEFQDSILLTISQFCLIRILYGRWSRMITGQWNHGQLIMPQIVQCIFRTISISSSFSKFEPSQWLEYVCHIGYATKCWHTVQIKRYVSKRSDVHWSSKIRPIIHPKIRRSNNILSFSMWFWEGNLLIHEVSGFRCISSAYQFLRFSGRYCSICETLVIVIQRFPYSGDQGFRRSPDRDLIMSRWDSCIRNCDAR
jgi:hypothetical protein